VEHSSEKQKMRQHMPFVLGIAQFEHQCGDRLKILVTDDGELLSKAVTDWCAESGIEHQLTA
jgi:hypothetical protein